MIESTMSDGRIAVYVPDHPCANNRGYVLRYRYVMEQYIGRYLTSDEEIHHIDENKTNDDISNLQLMTKAEHIKLHRRTLNYDWIKELREQGFGYKRIAKITDYSVDSIKSAIKRNGL